MGPQVKILTPKDIMVDETTYRYQMQANRGAVNGLNLKQERLLHTALLAAEELDEGFHKNVIIERLEIALEAIRAFKMPETEPNPPDGARKQWTS